MQNIMASRYIVAQQRRHGGAQGSGEIVGVLEGSAAQQGKPVYRSYNQPDILGCQHYKRRYVACQLKTCVSLRLWSCQVSDSRNALANSSMIPCKQPDLFYCQDYTNVRVSSQ